MSELDAYLSISTGPAGQVRPLHDPGCPAREAWVPLIRCCCPVRLAGLQP